MAKVNFKVGQHFRISKKKIMFANGVEQNFSTEILRNANVIDRRPRLVYELEDVNTTPKEGQFYGEEMTPFRILKQSNTR